MPAPDLQTLWNQILGGRNPYGSAGPINFDPTYHGPNPWFSGHENSEGGWAWDSASTADPRLHLGGNQPYFDGDMVPLGGLSMDALQRILMDPNGLTYDPTYGMATHQNNLRQSTRAGI
jgi:hypothetical protein